MSTDCEMLGHPLVVGDGGCPCGFHAKTAVAVPSPVTLPAADRVWWAGVPRMSFGAPMQTCDHPPIASPQ